MHLGPREERLRVAGLSCSLQTKVGEDPAGAWAQRGRWDVHIRLEITDICVDR